MVYIILILLTGSYTIGYTQQEQINWIICNLTPPKVSPVIGTTDTLFTFTVTYHDKGNDPPTFVEVYIDGIRHKMEKKDKTDTDYTDGCTYVYVTKIPKEGLHTYWFATSDGCFWVKTQVLSGPIVSSFPERIF
jgi:hypothetical protein